MTDIQIKYWDYKEGQRHNLTYETETNRHNFATEQQAARDLVEVNRHNVVSEGIDARNASSNEHNAASNRMNAESNRMNAYSNQSNAESNRMNAYSNQRMASASATQANAALRNASVKERQVAVSEAMLPYEQKKAAASASNYSAKTKGQNISNEISSATKKAQIASPYIGLIADVFSIGKSAASLFGR